MSNDDAIDWQGQSGSLYRYWILELPKVPSAIKDEGGNYIFAKRAANGRYVPLYIGETDSLRKRIPGHEVWPDATRLGVTHVLSHTTPAGDVVRKAEEEDLIRYWNPPLNKQHRRTG